MTKVCGHLLVKHLIPISWALIWSWSTLCCYNSLYLFLKGFPLHVGTLLRGLASFHPRALVRLGTNVGRLGLARSRTSNSSQRCSMGLRSGALCRPVKLLNTDLEKTFLYGPRFVYRCIVMLKHERSIPKLMPQSWKHRVVYKRL